MLANMTFFNLFIFHNSISFSQHMNTYSYVGFIIAVEEKFVNMFKFALFHIFCVKYPQIID